MALLERRLQVDGLAGLLADLDADGTAGPPRTDRRLVRPARASPRNRCGRTCGHRLAIDALWSHQAEAIDLVRGRHARRDRHRHGVGQVAVLPGARSPRRSADPIRPGTALLVFPTKALAQDQLRALAELELPGLVAATYDGDCTPEERTWVRRNANVVLTNPEMLHCGAAAPSRALGDVPHAPALRRGRRAARVPRRVRHPRRPPAAPPAPRVRVVRVRSPTFVFCVGDDRRARPSWPSELWGARRGRGHRRRLAPRRARRSRCATRRCSTSMPACARRPLRDRPGCSPTLIAAPAIARSRFCRSRRGTEVVAADVRRRLAGRSGRRRCGPYRGGYLPDERREIEGELFGGRLRGVVATTALELGVDIGGLDACVLDGFPGTIASMWQQMGRAGRERQQSLAVLVAGEDQLDQWLMAHPTEVFTRPPEPAVINPSNPFILHPHLACAAFELPLTQADERWWPDLDDGVRGARARRPAQGRDRRRRARPCAAAVWAGRGFPAHGVGLRSRLDRRVPHRRATTTRWSAPSTRPGRSTWCTRARSTCTRARRYRVVELDLDDRRRRRRAVRRQRVHRRPHRHRPSACSTSTRERAVGRRRLAPRIGRGRVAGHRLPAQGRRPPARCSAPRRSTCRRARLVTRGVWYTIEPADLARRRRRAGRLARHAARGRARGHRHPAAVHDLRPLGRRRRVHRCARPTRACRRSSSTTAIRAAPASPSSATTRPTAISRPPSR